MNNPELAKVCLDYILDRNRALDGPILETIYLDYFNDYLTIAQLAEHSELREELLGQAIDLGREYNHSEVLK